MNFGVIPPPPFVVVADDLTGAAEIAAIGHRHGLESVVALDERGLQSGARLIVFDTDSRLDDAPMAANKIAKLGAVLACGRAWGIYKKTDSVLRGPVRAELEALARALGRSCVLLVPANPVLGRTVRAGRYAIHGVPLHETDFKNDPHHPARTADVAGLLGADGSMSVAGNDGNTPLAASALTIGDAVSTADLDAWAQRNAPDVLLAGAGEFFSAWLRFHGFSGVPPSAPVAHSREITLIVSGTTSPRGAALRQEARTAGVPVVSLPEAALRESAVDTAIDEWTKTVAAHLMESRRALVVYDGLVTADERIGAMLRRTFAEMIRRLSGLCSLQHIIIEGGATAAAIARTLSWRELQVVHEWAPGVVSLQPPRAIPITVTLKPGSYAWPPALWQMVASFPK